MYVFMLKMYLKDIKPYTQIRTHFKLMHVK